MQTWSLSWTSAGLFCRQRSNGERLAALGLLACAAVQVRPASLSVMFGCFLWQKFIDNANASGRCVGGVCVCPLFLQAAAAVWPPV